MRIPTTNQITVLISTTKQPDNSTHLYNQTTACSAQRLASWRRAAITHALPKNKPGAITHPRCTPTKNNCLVKIELYIKIKKWKGYYCQLVFLVVSRNASKYTPHVSTEDECRCWHFSWPAGLRSAMWQQRLFKMSGCWVYSGQTDSWQLVVRPSGDGPVAGSVRTVRTK